MAREVGVLKLAETATVGSQVSLDAFFHFVWCCSHHCVAVLASDLSNTFHVLGIPLCQRSHGWHGGCGECHSERRKQRPDHTSAAFSDVCRKCR